MCQEARRLRTAETGSSSYGLVVHFPLLSTPPHGDAVMFSCGPGFVGPKRTYTSLIPRAPARTNMGVSPMFMSRVEGLDVSGKTRPRDPAESVFRTFDKPSSALIRKVQIRCKMNAAAAPQSTL